MRRSLIRWTTLPVLTASVLLAAAVVAQSKKEWREAAESDQANMHLAQSYHGTQPGTGNTLPKVEAVKDAEIPYITWPGFLMMEDGRSRLFVQLTQQSAFTEKWQGKKKLVITFADTRIYLSNNRNPLITTHFNTPLASARLRKKRKNTQLIITLKRAVEPTIHFETMPDGYRYLLVDFPAGNFAADASSQPAGPRQEIDDESPSE